AILASCAWFGAAVCAAATPAGIPRISRIKMSFIGKRIASHFSQRSETDNDNRRGRGRREGRTCTISRENPRNSRILSSYLPLKSDAPAIFPIPSRLPGCRARRPERRFGGGGTHRPRQQSDHYPLRVSPRKGATQAGSAAAGTRQRRQGVCRAGERRAPRVN